MKNAEAHLVNSSSVPEITDAELFTFFLLINQVGVPATLESCAS